MSTKRFFLSQGNRSIRATELHVGFTIRHTNFILIDQRKKKQLNSYKFLGSYSNQCLPVVHTGSLKNLSY